MYFLQNREEKLSSEFWQWNSIFTSKSFPPYRVKFGQFTVTLALLKMTLCNTDKTVFEIWKDGIYKKKGEKEGMERRKKTRGGNNKKRI